MKKVLFAVMLASVVAPAARAQGCSVCTKTAQGLDEKSAKGLNGGILYLAFLPLGIIGTVSILWLRSKNSQA